MDIFKVPTGFIIVDEYSKGKLETLSIGDYGKEYNIKADFLGYDRPLNGVKQRRVKPLQEKWVITLSTQYGCPMKCTFCDVPNVGFKGNATADDMKKQLLNARKLYPKVKYTDRLNIHFARMGEPSFNEDVFLFSDWLNDKKTFQEETELRVETIHPVFTTMCPKMAKTGYMIEKWVNEYKNGKFNGQAGLQLSINATDEAQRQEMFSNMAMTLEEIAIIGEKLPDPLGRKYCLNFAYASNFIIDGKYLASLFDPEKFMVKITPIHHTEASEKHGLDTINGYVSYDPYQEVEQDLKDAGFDVLVFVPSFDEEYGRITCGNAILGGSKLKVEFEHLKETTA